MVLTGVYFAVFAAIFQKDFLSIRWDFQAKSESFVQSKTRRKLKDSTFYPTIEHRENQKSLHVLKMDISALAFAF